MRISGGKARGIVLKVPRGHDFRPAMDRLRQGVFSSLGPQVEGARFIDLFAGTGSYGLEAVSRGAAAGFFVERDRAAANVLKSNIQSVCRSAERTSGGLVVSCSDAMLWTPPEDAGADLVFVDPPFAQIPDLSESIFRRCAGFASVSKSAVLVFQMPGELELESPGWRFLKRIGKGRNQPTCCFYLPE